MYYETESLLNNYLLKKKNLHNVLLMFPEQVKEEDEYLILLFREISNHKIKT
jgi:hypothetical protein